MEMKTGEGVKKSGSWEGKGNGSGRRRGRKKLGADIISAVRGSRPIGSGSANSSGGGATQCQPEPAQTKACAVLVRLGVDWSRALSLVLLACWLVLFTSVVPGSVA